MGRPKRHHYIPELILKNFGDEEGNLHSARRIGNDWKFYSAAPSNIFVELHLYSTESEGGERDSTTEGDLAKLESDSKPLIESLISCARNGEPPSLTVEQCELWYQFFFTQWRRTPEEQRSAVSDEVGDRMTLELLADAAARFPGRSDEITRLSSAKNVRRMANNARVALVTRESSRVMEVLRSRRIALLFLDDRKKSFVIGSRPVVKITNSRTSDLSHVSVEAWLPVSPDVAVGVGNRIDPVSLIRVRDPGWVRQFNLSVAKQSRVIAGRSLSLIKSIARAS